MRKLSLTLFTLFLFLYTLGLALPVTAYPQGEGEDYYPPAVNLPDFTPAQITDITDVVTYLKVHPELGATEASYLLSWIKPYHPIPETIIQIDAITVNTVTAATYETSTYPLPATVEAKTNLGNTIQVPVTWRGYNDEYEYTIITEASTATPGTFIYYGEVENYYYDVLFILTVTDVDDYRIVLNWGTSPSDLDSHLFGQHTVGVDQFHLYYSVTSHVYEQMTVAELDIDITTGHGPEITTIYMANADWDYKFGVYQYSSYGILADSNATVKLYQGDTLLATYQVTDAIPTNPFSTGDERYWNIFEIIDGELVEVMTLDDQWTASFPLVGEYYGI